MRQREGEGRGREKERKGERDIYQGSKLFFMFSISWHLLVINICFEWMKEEKQLRGKGRKENGRAGKGVKPG